MNQSRVELHGLSQLRAALRRLPEELTEEASAIVFAHADEAERRVRAAYPERTGNLKRGVRVEKEGSKLTASATLRSRARHSHLFERGTGPRRTDKGWNRGRMPAASNAQQMIAIVIRQRRAMVEALKAMVRRAGFQVNG